MYPPESLACSPDFFGSRHFPYYIASPGFTQRSAGPRALHHLCHILNELGYEAYITANKTSPRLRTPLLEREIIEKHDDAGRPAIAVYPEVVPGNPLQRPVVARWLLNRAGHLRRDHGVFTPEELIFYWDRFFLRGEKTEGQLFIPHVDSNIFHEGDALPENRTGFCYYAHKYLSFGGRIAREIVANGISLCQDIPRPVEEIVEILRTSKVLYCYEPSSMVIEAVACGCPAVFVITDYLRQFDVSSIAIPGMRVSAIPEEDLDFSSVPLLDKVARDHRFHQQKREALQSVEHFIKVTQAAAETHAKKTRKPVQRLQQGIMAFQTDDDETAIAHFSALLKTEPQNPLPPAYLAFIAARQKDVAAAADFIGIADRLAPDRADLKAALGESFLKSGMPDWAAKYLQAAILARPDFLEAYPAYAQCLHLSGQDEAAVALLLPVAGMPSPVQTSIQDILLEILARQGDLRELARAHLRFPRALADELAAVRALSHFEADGERLLETLGRVQQRLADACVNSADGDLHQATGRHPVKIAFLIGDFAREARLRRLFALLSHLPPEDFVTCLLVSGPRGGNDDHVNFCALLADHVQVIHGMDDAGADDLVRKIAPDVLIDLDAYGPEERLKVFLEAKVSHKLLWGEAPMPPLSPQCRVLAGERLASDPLPCVTLPEMGEYCDLPDWPMETPSRPAGTFPRFGCLTPTARIDREGWRLFAAILEQNPGSALLLNLQDLGKAAQDFIGGEFARHGIAAERLRFARAHTPEALCRLWREVDLGLHPPVDAGDLALPACLWMGRPYLALASPLPWSRRPAALLELAGAGAWICQTPEAYLEGARRIPPAPDPQFRARIQETGMHDPRIFAQGFAKSMKALFA